MNNRTALLSLIAFALVQPVSSQTQPDPAQVHDITGTVINSVTHQPIARALVKTNQGIATFTDREGRFAFPDVKDPVLFVSAEKPGYFFRQPTGVLSGTGIVESLSNTPTAPRILELTPEAIISGTVTDSAGAPLSAMQLTLYQSLIQNGMKRWQQTNGATTDAEGEFRFANLSEGDYYLATQFNIEEVIAEDVREGYVPVRYPEGTGAITLAAGQQKSVSFSVRTAKFYPVTGSLNGKNSPFGVVYSVSSQSGEETPGVAIYTPGADTFGILLPNGSYLIQATAFGQLQRLMASASVTVNGKAVSGVPLNFAPLANFPIEVELQPVSTNDTSDPPATPFYPPLSLVSTNNLRSSAHPGEYSAQPANEKTRQTYAFSGVLPGQYFFSSYPYGPWHATSARCGSVDLMQEPLTVASGAAGCAIHAVFSNTSATLSLSAIKNGKPIAAFAHLVPESALTETEIYISADGTGTTAVPEGRYDIVAFDEHKALEYRNPEVMQRYAQYTRSITLTAGQNATIQLDVAPSEK